MPDTTSEVRTCSKCEQVKLLPEFPQGKGYCKLCRTEYERERYRNDPEVRARRREARERNKDRWREYHADHYRKNRERKIAATAKYQQLNPVDPARRRHRERRWVAANYEHHRAVKRAWQATNSDKVNENRRRGVSLRRARLRALPSERYTLTQIIVRDGMNCVLCGEGLDLEATFPHPNFTTVEHLECLAWPDSAGDVLANVAASHLQCNRARGTKPHPAATAKRAELLTAEPA